MDTDAIYKKALCIDENIAELQQNNIPQEACGATNKSFLVKTTDDYFLRVNLKPK